MTSTGRVARLTALALATGTLVAAGASTAGAATTNKTIFTASGGGSVLRLTVNLPIEVPGIGSSLTQDLVLTGGSVRTGDAAAAIGNAVLGANGTVPAVSALLDKSVTAEYGKPAPADVNAFPAALSALGITGDLLALTSRVNNPNVDGVTSHSKSAVANLRIEGAGSLQALLDALASQLTGLLNVPLPVSVPGIGGSGSTGGTAVTSLTGLVTGLATQVTDLVDSSTSGASAPLTEPVKAALNQLASLLNALPAAIAGNIKATAADTSLLSVGLIQSEQTVSRAAGVVTSKSDNVLTDIKVLGGLVTISGLSSTATAALGDGISSASPKAVGDASLLHVNVADLLSVDVADDLKVLLGGSLLPAEVVTAVNGALAQVTAALNGLLGATLTGAKVTQNIETADKAAAAVSAAHFEVNPSLPSLGGAAPTALFAKPLVTVDFVPAQAQVVKAQSAVPPVVITPGKAGSTPSFAPTGANFGLTAPVAVALMGLAVVARRRRLAHVAD
ncbi:MAG: hypothetical protein M3P04_04500 [Actinomycetota bacterium]|nr:hypothetical protein [Actinomycetota bacterium]